MKINKTNIKSILGISSTTYDNQIESSIPSIIESICGHCRRDFILKNRVSGYVYDLTSMVFTSTTITLSTDLPLVVGDFIKIYGTVYNDGIYQIKTYSGGIITIETAKEMRTESNSNCYIALIQFPDKIIDIIAKLVDRTIVNDRRTASKESIDDYSIDLRSHNDILGELNEYRLVYPQNIFT